MLRTAASDPWAASRALVAAGLASWTVGSEAEVQVDADEFLCAACSAWFPARGQLSLHGIRAHGGDGPTRLVRSVVVGPICPACGVNFHSRLRVCRHLRHGAAACVLACASGQLPVFSEAEILAADERDRLERAVRHSRAGVRDMAGPRVIRGGQVL